MSERSGKSRPKKRTTGHEKAARPVRESLLLWARRLAIVAVFAATLGLAAVSVLFWYYGRDLPEVTALRSYEPPETTRVLDRHGKLIGEIYHERRTVVPMDQIPRVFVLSVLAAEDADFYEHKGLDYPGMLRALIRDLTAGKGVQGASTITQQVVKLMLLTPERSIARKTKELILARRLEQTLTKEGILHLYLNHINFGHGRYGVEEASRYYFNKGASELTLAEASLIAGVPQSPSRLSPRTHPENARRRQEYVLRQLAEKRAQYWPDLAPEEIEEALHTKVQLAAVPEARSQAPDVVVMARSVLREHVGEEEFRLGGYTIHTTLDLALQQKAREALQKGLRELDARHGYRAPLHKPKRTKRTRLKKVDRLRVGGTYDAVVTGAEDEVGALVLDVGGHEAIADVADHERYNPEGLPPSKFAEPGAPVRVSVTRVPNVNEDGPEARAEVHLELGPQGAVVLLEPRSRDVLALIGSYENVPGFNRATQAVRQPGSTFKAIVYAEAIRSRKLTPASIVVDAPAVYDEWRPRNFEAWRHQGPMRLREALAGSVNLVAVRVIEKVGPKSVANLARALGITTELEESLGLALGASDVRPIELTNAYATLAAGGRWAPTRFIQRIEARSGETLKLPSPERPRDVLSPAEAYVVTSMLTSVVDHGTAKAAKKLGRPAAGKTGTSSRARDAWFVGFTPSAVAGVWVGFDDRRPLGRRETGGHAALPIWIDTMGAGVDKQPVVDFPVPNGVETAEIDPASGLLAYEGMEGSLEEVFVAGTVPTETARPPDVADPSTFLMEQLGAP